MRTIETRLKKCSVRICGWGPSDCQKSEGEGLRRAATPQPGLCVDTVQDAREEISRRFAGIGAEVKRPASVEIELVLVTEVYVN